MKTLLKIFLMIRPYWKQLSLSILCTLLFALFNGVSIYLTMPLLNTLFSENGTKSTIIDNQGNNILPGFINNLFYDIKYNFNNLIFSGTNSEILLKICFLIFLAYFFKNLFGYLQSYFLSFVEQKFIKDLRDKAYERLHQLPMSYFKNEQTGELISRITNDVQVAHSISAVFLNLIREPISIMVFLAMAISISWELTLFAFIVTPFSLIVIGYVGKLLRKQSRILQEKIADITTILEETISGVKIVKAFGMEKYETEKFKKETTSYSQIILKMIWTRNASSPITELLSVVVGVIVIYYGGSLVLDQHVLRADQFITFLLTIFMIMPPVKELTSVNNRIQEASAAADRIFEIIEIEPTIKDNDNPIEKNDIESKVEFNNLFFKYDDSDENILENINFTVEKGQIIAFVGASGSGKTTLVDLLPRFYDPYKGGVYIDGINIKDIKLTNLRKMMGIVTQETLLFNESIKNNIAYGLNDFPIESVIQAAKIANAHNFILDLPNGYDTIVGERGTKLSGGQRQRIAIARALLKNPPIMIFDEATSALDNESELLVQEAIEKLMSDRTTFVIAHRLSTIQNAHKIIVLDQGKIVQTGDHKSLLNDEKGLYKKLYELQFRS